MKHHQTLLTAYYISAAAVVLTGHGANAQAVAPPTTSSSPPASAAVLPEIIVTAERRQSSVQSAPLSITAITGHEIQSRGITSVADLARDVPGVSFRSAGPGQTELEIRGLSSTGGASPTVGFYLDDTPLTAPAAAENGKVVVDPDLYDLARVEVLRGPQGTLYGSGSEGGTVRLITTEPKLNQFSGTIEADGSGTVSGGPNGALNAAINIPVIWDKIAVRAVVTDKYNSGWIDRVVENPFPLESNNGCTPTSYYGCARGDVLAGNIIKENKNVNWEQLQGGRVELLIEPTPKLKILTTALYQGIRQGGPKSAFSNRGPQVNPGVVAIVCRGHGSLRGRRSAPCWVSGV